MDGDGSEDAVYRWLRTFYIDRPRLKFGFSRHSSTFSSSISPAIGFAGSLPLFVSHDPAAFTRGCLSPRSLYTPLCPTIRNTFSWCAVPLHLVVAVKFLRRPKNMPEIRGIQVNERASVAQFRRQCIRTSPLAHSRHPPKSMSTQLHPRYTGVS